MDYHYDENNILKTKLKNRTLPCIMNGITKFHEKLINQGLPPKIHIMESEVSEDLEKYFYERDIKLQLVPQHMYQKNAAE